MARKTHFAFKLLTAILFCCPLAQAHPYLPNLENLEVTYDYSFEVETDKKEFKQADTKGRMFSKSAGQEEKNGKTYQKITTSYQDIPFMKETSTVWRREENGNVFLGYDKAGKFVETLELPADIALGSEWEYNDGVASRRKVTAKLDLKLKSGKILPDCLEVTRTVLKKSDLSKLIDKAYYCQGHGAAKTIFHQLTPIGTYKTETELSSLQP